MNDYVYQDKEATMPTLSAMLTSRMGDQAGNHEAAYLDAIDLLIAAFGDGAMIDIGCGRGRVAEAAAGRVKEVVALEPDPGRCNWTKELLAAYPEVTVLDMVSHEYIARWPEKKFDLVVLGMVLQHISTHNCSKLMQDINTLTRPGGMVIVSTTHALEKAKCFTYQHVVDARISEEEFNAYADQPRSHDKGLPVHRFSRAEFESLVTPGFEVVQWNEYSYYRPEFLERFARVHQVKPEDLSNIGNSQYLVLKKLGSD
jgi:cyclopropane fatty-acyl-phospholipid synthase-like methyltransferase